MYPTFWENFENSIPLSEGMCVGRGAGGGSNYEEHYQNSRKSTIRSADKSI